MKQWIVEYYSDDNGEWLECSNNFTRLPDAIRCMRRHTQRDPDMPHRLVEIARTTVALAAYGEELLK